MYIKRIKLSNIRCFEELEIDLSAGEGIKNWMIILGDNGVGKTTLLRSIAMGLNDIPGATSLLSELYGRWRREGAIKTDSFIDMVLVDSLDPSKEFRIKTTIKDSPAGNYEISQETDPADNFPWEDIFVCGYGSARRGYGSVDYEEYSSVDSTYTLFNYDAALQNPELMLRRLEATADKDFLYKFLSTINEILMLEQGSTTLEVGGITIKGPWGTFKSLGSLGDGYQATLGWVVDLLGWVLLNDKADLHQDLRGIVILDELEQHLHPRWQRYIISLLHKQFPRLQFVATSHSALCASGAADLEDYEYILYLLKMGENFAVSGLEMPSLRGYRADQILTSDAFDLSTTRNPRIEEKLARLRELVLLDSKSPDQQSELTALSSYLRETLPSVAESEEMRKIQEETLRLLSDLSSRLKESNND